MVEVDWWKGNCSFPLLHKTYFMFEILLVYVIEYCHLSFKQLGFENVWSVFHLSKPDEVYPAISVSKPLEYISDLEHVLHQFRIKHVISSVLSFRATKFNIVRHTNDLWEKYPPWLKYNTNLFNKLSEGCAVLDLKRTVQSY